jgi:hypothetical protein
LFFFLFFKKLLSYRFALPSRLRILGGPLFGGRDSRLFVFLPALGNIGSERIVGVRGTKKSLDREKDSSDLKGGGPIVLEYVKTDASKLINVGVEDLGKESDLWRCHGVVVGQEELKVKDTALVRRLSGTVDLNIEISEVILVGDGTDSWNRLGHEPFCLFNNALRESHLGNLVRLGMCGIL